MKGLLFYFSIVSTFIATLYAGTNSLTSVSGGKVQTNHVNQYYTALNQDFVPRSSSGVPTAIGGNLGTSTYPWNACYLGAAADGISLTDSSGDLLIGGNNGVKINPTGTFTLQSNGTTIFAANSTGITSNLAHWINRSSLPSVGQQIGSSTGSFSTSNTTFTSVTNASVSITTTGRPVAITLISDGSGSISNVACASTSAISSVGCVFEIQRGGVGIADMEVGIVATAFSGLETFQPPSSIYYLDPVGAGTYTYALVVKNINANQTALVNFVKFMAEEQ